MFIYSRCHIGANAVLCLIVLLTGSSTAFAQITYTGKVLDAATGETLPDVSVFVPGTTIGTATDRDGVFELTLRKRPTALTFSSIGFRTKTLGVSELLTNSVVVLLQAAVVDLSPVVVSASREMQSRTQIPSSISSLSASQMDQSHPSMLYQALNQVAGIYMVDLGNEQYKMSIRQPFTNKAYFLYMEDGVPLRPTGIFNPNALIDINMAGISRVEVVRGPVSAMYGSNAVAGALNFITPTPSTAPAASVSARLDNRGYRRTDFSASVLRGKLGVFAGGYAARQRNGWFDHSDFDKLALTARADYAFSESSILESVVTVSSMDTDTNGALDSLSFFSQNISSLHTFTYREMGATRARTTFSHRWSEESRTRITVFYRNARIGQLPYYRIRNIRSNPSKATGEINEDSFWSLGALAQHEFYVPDLNTHLVIGTSFDRSPATYWAEYIDVERDELGRYTNYYQPDSLLTDYDIEIRNAAVFARFEIEPLERLRVVASARFDHLRYDYDNHLDADAFSGVPDGISTFTQLSPKIGLTYDLQGGVGIYANYSLGFVPPEVNELYTGVKIPNLKPALFGSYEVGGWATLLKGKLFFDASAYAMTGIEEIIPVVLDDGGRENRNAGRTRHRGVEYTLLYQPTGWLSLRVSGTNALHEFVNYNENGVDYSGNEMMNAPAWTSNSEIAFDVPAIPSLRFAVEWQHLGPYQLDNSNTSTYSGYDVFNARGSFSLRSWEIWMNVNNVLDEVYATTAAAYAFGTLFNSGQVRTIAIGLRYRR